MMSVLMFCKIMGYGWLILVIAIMINVAARAVDWKTWYDFIAIISDTGIRDAISSLSWLESLFLFILYPGIFGVVISILVQITQKKRRQAHSQRAGANGCTGCRP